MNNKKIYINIDINIKCNHNEQEVKEKGSTWWNLSCVPE